MDDDWQTSQCSKCRTINGCTCPPVERRSNADYQRAYRQRQASLRTQLNTRTEALEAIVELLQWATDPNMSATMARQIALTALEGEK